VISIFRNSIGAFLAFTCLLQNVEASSEELRAFKIKVEEVRNSLSGIAQKLQELKTKKVTDISSSPSFSILEKSEPFIPKKPKVSIVESSTRNASRAEKVGRFDPSGFYILPFLGLLTSGNLTWDSLFLGEFDIEEGVGTSTGMSIGYEGKNFFSDLQLSYMQNRMKSMNLPFSASFSGKSLGIGVHLNGGGRIHLNQFIACSIGVGVGGVDQDLSFLLSGVPFEVNDFLMSYQIFTGIEYRPTESSTMGLRYRWLSIDEMDAFSSRDLHLMELWLGYLF
jgi:opacity protein-like surface antigen